MTSFHESQLSPHFNLTGLNLIIYFILFLLLVTLSYNARETRLVVMITTVLSFRFIEVISLQILSFIAFSIWQNLIK